MLIGGRYRLVSLAGRGGMAEVWRAEALGAAGFRRTVAVKRVLGHLLHTDLARQMFVEEARVTSLLDHPNVVQVTDFGEDDQGFFLVMEWVEGISLRDFLDTLANAGSQPSPALVGAIGIEVLHALEAAHTHVTRNADGTTRTFPIIHRDVSPANVLLSVRGVVKLADFGFARAFDRSGITPAGIVKGKLGYLSPEQARGEPASARSDLYSCGVMLWEMLTGRRLFEGRSDRTIARSLLARAKPDPVRSARPDVPEPLAAAVDQAVAPDPAERPRSASVFARALADALRTIPERTDATRIAAEVDMAVTLRGPLSIAPEADRTHDATEATGRLSLSVKRSNEPSMPFPLVPGRKGDE